MYHNCTDFIIQIGQTIRQYGTKGLVGQLPNMGIPTAYVGACTSDPNPHPELI